MEYRFIDKNASVPYKTRKSDAGLDIASCIDVVIPPRSVVNVRTGLQMAPPNGWYYTIDGRSSLFKKGIVPFRGIIDSGYTAEIFIALYNSTDTPYEVHRGDRIAQATIHRTYDFKLIEVDEFSQEYKIRGDKGWGSTGR